MKKIFYLVLLFLPLSLYAQSQLLSPIPLPSQIIIDLDTTPYDDAMLEEALAQGQIFTFLAKSGQTENPDILAKRRSYMALFNLKGRIYGQSAFRIAFLVSKKVIGKYAVSTTHSALAYLLNRGIPFEMDVFSMPDESTEALQNAVGKIATKEPYDLIVAPVTRSGAEYLCNQILPARLYIPTLHKSRIDCINENVFFGGIDYTRQIETLSYLVESNATTITVSDKSGLSKMLSETVAQFVDINDSIELTKNGYYKDLISRHEDLNQSTIYLNTPVVKSSLFLSQLTLADFKPALILSTQINYSPLLLTLTQYHDRENMILANSVGTLDPFLTENVALVNQDVRFNWLNYATVVGIDSFFNLKTAEPRLSREPFANRSLDYEIRLYEAGLYRFIPREIPYPEVEEILQPYEEEEQSPAPYSPLSQADTSR
ncbi:hypothetical protein [Hydrogenimonas urashimensis]|uniref:hypothetical protein n=1 Tax=Hydrogenimonas urashimensis TaxID=2740515 RepID=UPI001915CE5A|nr:hypothetical protein [Hydrogenimonas urashimensis]